MLTRTMLVVAIAATTAVASPPPVDLAIPALTPPTGPRPSPREVPPPDPPDFHFTERTPRVAVASSVASAFEVMPSSSVATTLEAARRYNIPAHAVIDQFLFSGAAWPSVSDARSHDGRWADRTASRVRMRF